MMSAVAFSVRVTTLCCAVMFVVAIAHKVVVLLGSTTNELPLLRSFEFSTRRPRIALAATGAAEVGVVAALVSTPVVGLAATTALLSFYAWALSRLPASVPCNCFGEFLSRSSGDGVRRNLVLAILCVVALVAGIASSVEDAVPDAATGGAVLVVFACLFGASHLRTVFVRARSEVS